MTDKRDTPALCVFEVDGKPCARPETHGVHNETVMSDAKLYFRHHTYTPPDSTFANIMRPALMRIWSAASPVPKGKL